MILANLLPGRRRTERSIAKEERRIRSVTRTHVGRVRTVNEDRVFDCAERGLWAVADGMGGHFSGDVAAQRVVDALRTLVDSRPHFDDGMIDAALNRTGRRIHAEAGGSARISGSTIIALHIDRDEGMVFWAGDSRAYRLRAGRIEQLSRDHSLVQELVDAGALAPEQAHRHPQAHVITRALGTAADVAIERRAITVAPGDLYLLCSDGLARGQADPDLLDRLDGPLDTIADRLLDDALTAGGADNISLVLIAVG